MGWTSFYSNYKTNKESFVHEVLNDKKVMTGKDGQILQEYLEVAQKGSDIFLLGKDADGKYWIDLFICRRERGQFWYKGMGAFENAKGGTIPKKWLAYFNCEDTEVKKYLERTLQEEQKKSLFDFGTVLKCTNGRGEITWTGFSIKENEEFYVRVEVMNPYAKRKTKLYRIMRKNEDGVLSATNYRLKEQTLKYCPKIERME